MSGSYHVWASALVLAFSALPGGTSPIVIPGLSPSVASVPLGRANPFLPLIKSGAVTALPKPPAWPAGQVPPPLLPAAPRRVEPTARFVGIIFDQSEAIAAVQLNGRTRLMHVGQRLEGAEIVGVAPGSLKLRRNGRTIVMPLAKSAGGTP